MVFHADAGLSGEQDMTLLDLFKNDEAERMLAGIPAEVRGLQAGVKGQERLRKSPADASQAQDHAACEPSTPLTP